MRERQQVNRVYGKDSEYTEYRAFVVDWLLKKSSELGYHSETTHHAVTLADAFFSQVDVPLNKRILVSSILLGFASQLHEEESKQLKQNGIYQLNQREFDTRTISRTEIQCFNRLDGNFNVLTISECLGLFFSCGVVFSNDSSSFREIDENLLYFLRKTSYFLGDLSLQSRFLH